MRVRNWSAVHICVGLLPILLAGPGAAQTWLDFAHPSIPHLGMPNPNVFINLPGLYGAGDALVQRPTLLVLMDWSDMTHRAVHTTQFWHDLVFADPPAPGEMSVRQVYHDNSDGRLWLVPATAGDTHDGSIDGVIGWVASAQAAVTYTDPSMKRAEGRR